MHIYSNQFSFIYTLANHNNSHLSRPYNNTYREKPSNHMTPYKHALWRQWDGKSLF